MTTIRTILHYAPDLLPAEEFEGRVAICETKNGPARFRISGIEIPQNSTSGTAEFRNLGSDSSVPQPFPDHIFFDLDTFEDSEFQERFDKAYATALERIEFEQNRVVVQRETRDISEALEQCRQLLDHLAPGAPTPKVWTQLVKALDVLLEDLGGDDSVRPRGLILDMARAAKAAPRDFKPTVPQAEWLRDIARRAVADANGVMERAERRIRRSK